MAYLPLKKLLMEYFEKWELQDVLDRIDEPVSGQKSELVERIMIEWPIHGNNSYDLFKFLDKKKLSRICKAYRLDSRGGKNDLVKRIKKVKLLESDSSQTLKITHGGRTVGNIVLIIVLVGIGSSIGYVFFYGIIPEKIITFTVTGGFVHQQDPDFPEDIDMIIKLKTTLLSAQNPITVEAKMIPSENFHLYKPNPWPYLPGKQYLIFPGALQYPLKNFPDGDYVNGIIELDKNGEPQEYFGEGRIIYQTGGDYRFLFVGPEFIASHSSKNGVEFQLSDIKEMLNENTEFNIQSDQTATLEGTKYTVISVLVGIGIAITKYRRSVLPRSF